MTRLVLTDNAKADTAEILDYLAREAGARVAEDFGRRFRAAIERLADLPGMVARRRECERNAVHDRHADVGEQKLEGAVLAGQEVERLRPVPRGGDLVAVLRQCARDQAADRVLIVGNEDACHAMLTGCRSWRRADERSARPPRALRA